MSLGPGHQFQQYLLDLYPVPRTEQQHVNEIASKKKINQQIPSSKIAEKYIYQNINIYNKSSNKIFQKDKNDISSAQKNSLKKYSANKFNLLQPWSQNDFQIIQYHKKQQMDQQKSKNMIKNDLKPQHSNITSQLPLRMNSQSERSMKQDIFHNSNQKSNLRMSKKLYQKQKTYTSRTQYKEDNFNTIITSKEEKLKWRIELQVMVNRRKKLTNLLKLRHFGYLKPNKIKNIDEKNKNNNQYDSLQNENFLQKFKKTSCKSKQWLISKKRKQKDNQTVENKQQSQGDHFQDSFIYTKVRLKETFKQNNKDSILKESLKDKIKQTNNKKLSFNQHKKQTNKQIQQLYSALRSYTKKNRVTSKGSFNLINNKGNNLDKMLSQSLRSSRLSTQFMKSKIINNSGENFQFEKHHRLVKNSTPFKKKNSSFISNNNQRKFVNNTYFDSRNKEKKHPNCSTSLSLQSNNTNYTRNSIKNKLKLLQSNFSKNRNKFKGTQKKLEIEYIQQASCFQKKQRQIKIHNFSL